MYIFPFSISEMAAPAFIIFGLLVITQPSFQFPDEGKQNRL